MVQSGTGKRGRKQPPGGEAPGDQSRQTSEAGTAGSGPRQSDLREQATSSNSGLRRYVSSFRAPHH